MHFGFECGEGVVGFLIAGELAEVFVIGVDAEGSEAFVEVFVLGVGVSGLACACFDTEV